MFSHKKSPSPTSGELTHIDTLIAEHCTIEGNLVTQNSVKVDGRIHGNLSGEGHVIIGEKGLVQGDVRCTELLVMGRLEGNLRAQHVHLCASAHIAGNIEAGTLQIDPGARYQGGVSMSGGDAPTQPA